MEVKAANCGELAPFCVQTVDNWTELRAEAEACEWRVEGGVPLLSIPHTGMCGLLGLLIGRHDGMQRHRGAMKRRISFAARLEPQSVCEWLPAACTASEEMRLMPLAIGLHVRDGLNCWISQAPTVTTSLSNALIRRDMHLLDSDRDGEIVHTHWASCSANQRVQMS